MCIRDRANTVSVEDMTGKDAFYKEEEKDGKKTGHMQALRSEMCIRDSFNGKLIVRFADTLTGSIYQNT